MNSLLNSRLRRQSWEQVAYIAITHTYERAGFVLVKEEPQRAFGADLVSETWDLQL